VSQNQYASGRLLVFLNGVAMAQGIDWAEQFPASGTFNFLTGTFLPTSSDLLTAQYTLTTGTSGGGIAEAPLDGLQYGRQSGSWTVVSGSNSFPEAPLDGLQYARQSGTWKQVTGSGGAGVPATYVLSGTNYNMPASVGTALEYARADHEHGTPPSGTGGGGTITTVSQDVRFNQSSGTSVYPNLIGNQNSSNLYYTVSDRMYS
jgi:hypothetical protein